MASTGPGPEAAPEALEQSSTQKERAASELTDSNDLKSSQWTTSRTELWAYYVFYIGNNGLSGFNFGPSQFQNLLSRAGYDPTGAPFSLPCGAGDCVLPFAGSVRNSEPYVVVV